MKKKYIYENAEVLRVIDGDTVILHVDLGFDTWKKVSVRLYGINAPEIKGESKELGFKSKEYLESLIPAGSFIKFHCIGQDKYGRWLGSLYKDDLDINKNMIENNMAVEYYCQLGGNNGVNGKKKEKSFTDH